MLASKEDHYYLGTELAATCTKSKYGRRNLTGIFKQDSVIKINNNSNYCCHKLV